MWSEPSPSAGAPAARCRRRPRIGPPDPQRGVPTTGTATGCSFESMVLAHTDAPLIGPVVALLIVFGPLPSAACSQTCCDKSGSNRWLGPSAGIIPEGDHLWAMAQSEANDYVESSESAPNCHA